MPYIKYWMYSDYIYTIPHLHSSKWILLLTSYFCCVCQPISSYSKALFSCPAFAKAFVQCQSCNSCRPHGTCPRNPMDPLGVLAVLLISGLCRHDSRKGNSEIRDHTMCIICDHWYRPSLSPRTLGIRSNPTTLISWSEGHCVNGLVLKSKTHAIEVCVTWIRQCLSKQDWQYSLCEGAIEYCKRF